MSIYGYSKRECSEKGLLEMREVTFNVSPDALRRVADFSSTAPTAWSRAPGGAITFT